jgi:hypothetical protein
MRIAIHLGLGDTIVCAPIIAKLAEGHEEIIVPCWRHNLESVESFFIDLPNVKVKVVTTHNELWDYEYRIGCYGESQRREGESFIDWFYRQAGMDREERLKYCPLLKASKHVKQLQIADEPTIFIHEDSLRDFIIDHISDKNEVRPLRASGSILKYVDILNKVDEIHCIDSSFLHLVESVPTKGRLLYHKYSRPYSETYNFIKEWKVFK